MSFTYKNKLLGIDCKSSFCDLAQFVSDDKEAFYLYDLDGIEQRFNFFKNGFAKSKNKVRVHYAMKANSNPLILQKLKSLGAHVDVVSIGEVELALKNNFKPEDIVFSGVGKSVKEITEALKLGVFQLNVESVAELKRIGTIAKKLNLVANVGIRFNPDVSPETHPYITTGFRENKFGLDFSEISNIDQVKKEFSEYLVLRGMSIHIGSQIRDNSSFVDALNKTIKHFNVLKNNPNWQLTSLDIGGGLGINYDNPDETSDLELIESYTQQVTEVLNGIEAEIICEPGRVIVGRFGVLLGKVEYIKQNEYKTFAIVNTGMHHLMRPCLYKAYHNILPIKQVDNKNVIYDIVGPICESSDVIGFDRLLPELVENDWLAIMEAGAYGFSMANCYNQHALPQEIVISKGTVVN